MIRKINTIDDIDDESLIEETDPKLLEEIKGYSDDKLQSEYVKCGEDDPNSERFALIQQELFDRGILSADDEEDEEDEEDTNDDDEDSEDEKDHSVEIMDSVGLISNFANEKDISPDINTIVEVRTMDNGKYRCYVSERNEDHAEYRLISRNDLVDMINSDDVMVQFYTKEQMDTFMDGKDLDPKELYNMNINNSILLYTSIDPAVLESRLAKHINELHEYGLDNAYEIKNASDYPFVKWGLIKPKSVLIFNFGVNRQYVDNMAEFIYYNVGKCKYQILDFSQLQRI